MNSVFRLIVFTIFLNIATGLVMYGVTDSGVYGTKGTQIFSDNTGNTFGIVYNESYTSTFVGDMNTTINPTGDLEDRDNAIYRVLDKMNLGFLTRIKDAVTKYLFGFIQFIQSTIGPYMEPALANFIFPTLKTVIFIGYLLGVWLLFTGRAFSD